MTTPGPSVSGQPTPKIVSGEYDDAAAQHDALVRAAEQARAENARLRQERNEARELLAAIWVALDVEPGDNVALPRWVEDLREDRDSCLVEAGELRTWRGLMELVDGHYPASVFPDGPDHSAGDDGPRILRLLRALDAERDRYRQLAGAVGEIAVEVDKYGSVVGAHEEVNVQACAAAFRQYASKLRALAATAPQPAPAEPVSWHEAAEVAKATFEQQEARRAALAEREAAPAEPPAAPVQPEERPAWPALAARLRTLGLPGLGDDPAEITDQVCRWLETLHEQARTQARVIVQYSGERDEARAALATAERARDEARRETAQQLSATRDVDDLRMAEIGDLTRTLDALRAEVRRIAEDCGVRAVQRAGTTNPSSRAAFVIYDKIATELRAALGSTPDTGSTA